ncbi:MAG TPA: alternative ribosome rescue aminoacyl-tRNA hydrolase ArfB, partial [Burkholderiaceae bacterium]|nr:alternative ribosome rescue aminoacyl-tRNA hydrolase ArfB [Burkholderiaceae bacterium]
MPRIAYVLDAREVRFEAVRAQGAGGQNVNKVSNAVVLRFDIEASSLPAALKARLRARSDQRISADGVVTIKAQEHRSLPRNRDAALERLRALIDAAAQLPRRRIATAPTRASK